mmetsp:Transcript_38950/g.64695  ORF Transcript_38950/g.64695 Transcript_38950/m.64695 type:complete len:109 (+) Transcript_38950:26-352(+)
MDLALGRNKRMSDPLHHQFQSPGTGGDPNLQYNTQYGGGFANGNAKEVGKLWGAQNSDKASGGNNRGGKRLLQCDFEAVEIGNKVGAKGLNNSRRGACIAGRTNKTHG